MSKLLGAVCLAALLAMSGGVQAQMAPAKPHFEGEVLMQTPAYRVSFSDRPVVDAMRTEAMASPRPTRCRPRELRPGNSLAIVFTGGPSQALTDTPDFRREFETAILPELERQCGRALRIDVSLYHDRYRAVGPTRLAMPATYVLAPREYELPFQGIRVLRQADGSMSYRVLEWFSSQKTSFFVSGTTLGQLLAESAGGSYDAFANAQMAQVVAEQAARTAAVASEAERKRALEAAADRILASMRDPSPFRLPSTPQSGSGVDFLTRVYHGTAKNEDTEWIYALVLFAGAYGKLCPQHLGPNVRQVQLTRQLAGATQMIMNGSGRIISNVTTPGRTEVIDTFPVRSRWYQVVAVNANTSAPVGQQLGTLTNPERARERERRRAAVLPAMTELFRNYACTSPEMGVVEENLYRLMSSNPSLQREVALREAEKLATGGSAPVISEREILRRFARR